jgi:dethiobiotin synthase
MSAIFVTGTDTGIGKTVVSAWLALHARADYWKPVQSGVDADGTDSELVFRWSGARIHAETLRLSEPLSPHLAAQRDGVRIQLQDFSLPSAGRLVVEGAGGVLVPLNDHDTMIDLMRHLALPVLLVARSGLGTINHTCLSVGALRARGVPVAGVVMVGDPNPENRFAITHYARVPVLAELPRLAQVTQAALQSHPVPPELLRLF